MPKGKDSTKLRPTEKLKNLLYFLEENFAESSNFSLTHTILLYGLPKDYCTILLKYGAIQKISKNKRGKTCYLWNPKTQITDSLALEMVCHYNSMRRGQRKSVKFKRGGYVESLEKRILELEKNQADILTNINQLKHQLNGTVR